MMAYGESKVGYGVLEEPWTLTNRMCRGWRKWWAWYLSPPSAGTVLRSHAAVAPAICRSFIWIAFRDPLENPQRVLNHHWRQLDLIWGHKQKSFRACVWSSWVFLVSGQKQVCAGNHEIDLFYYFDVVSKWRFSRLLARRKPLSWRHPVPLSLRPPAGE